MTQTQIYANNYKEVWEEPDGEKLAYQLPDDVAIEHFRNAQETINEVIRQNIKFGERRTLPDVTPPPSLSYQEVAAVAWSWVEDIRRRRASAG